MLRSWLVFLLEGRAILPRSFPLSFDVCSSLGLLDTWTGILLVLRLSIHRRQHKTRVFNVGNRRRLAQCKDDLDHPTEHDANFFDPDNAEYTATREHLAMDTLEELLHWLLEENGSVGILGDCHNSSRSFVDATNSTRTRRKTILERVRQIEDLNVLFIESICTDKKVLHCHVLLIVDTRKQYAAQAERTRL